MYKVDIRGKILNEMKLQEMIALVLSKKLDKPYEEVLKLTESIIDKKIDEVEKTFSKLGQQEDISIDNPKDVNDFIGDNTIIKG
jgi:hypothetical protein